MARGRSNFKMGMVEMIVLFLLKKQDLYGYQLTTLIKQLSDGKFLVSEPGGIYRQTPGPGILSHRRFRKRSAEGSAG